MLSCVNALKAQVQEVCSSHSETRRLIALTSGWKLVDFAWNLGKVIAGDNLAGFITVQHSKILVFKFHKKLQSHSDREKVFSSSRFNFDAVSFHPLERFANQNVSFAFAYKVTLPEWYLAGLLINLRLLRKLTKVRGSGIIMLATGRQSPWLIRDIFRFYGCSKYSFFHNALFWSLEVALSCQPIRIENAIFLTDLGNSSHFHMLPKKRVDSFTAKECLHFLPVASDPVALLG